MSARVFFFMADASLKNFIQELSGEDHTRVQDDLGNGFVRLRAAEAQRRQAKQDIRTFEDVVIEMLRNARDANAKAIFVATWADKKQRFLTMLDDGDGIPFNLQETVFEPFVTSKLDSFHSDRWGVHGRGMALYSIRQNTDSARVVASEPGLGSVLSVVSSFSRLKEKRDQSSAPSITLGENGKPVLRGPHNILRTVLEFAIDERNSVVVYLGSAAEVVSTLYWLGRNAASNVQKGQGNAIAQLPFIQRFAFCDDAASLAELSNSLQLPMSARTAYRIMSKEVKPLQPHLQAMLGEHKDEEEPVLASSSAMHQNGKARTIHLSQDDLTSFTAETMKLYAQLADAYYLDKGVEPTVRCSKDELVIRIPLRQPE